ncbi:hypothetical protein L1S34_14670 [Flavobacterium sp. K77]|uniref:hypothetical protein n=1 Tax=Flavobacterium sp. K77 TaxID=2910676 RepID=UPI001F4798CB|nr:hypothetical protein [Flavobacterium sp. K77]MCF6142533.1 hypothetical protein [Flavobacterium sp. K77]
MKFKKTHFLFLTLILLFCSFINYKKQNEVFIKTEFSETCLRISNEYKSQNEHGGHILNNKTKKYLSLSEFSKILKLVSKYDLNKKLNYKVEKNKVGKIERIIWKNTSKNSKLISFEKLTFKTEIEQKFEGKKYQNTFTIVDYTITNKEAPKKIYLRIMENEFERLSIDDVTYFGVFESRLLGIDDAKDELDELLNKK